MRRYWRRARKIGAQAVLLTGSPCTDRGRRANYPATGCCFCYIAFWVWSGLGGREGTSRGGTGGNGGLVWRPVAGSWVAREPGSEGDGLKHQALSLHSQCSPVQLLCSGVDRVSHGWHYSLLQPLQGATPLLPRPARDWLLGFAGPKVEGIDCGAVGRERIDGCR
ncbi:hypothetical protein B0T24DRAFT_160038 [Lasiosphaeria ovina]|uniref:Uncharacterized protein n=1 Tax=Lasiosphaeria ovina TaxID=92902 RepID=A0AAE0NDF7_9PEZI|nr:hypothetical protein B0T24DRAFT_160038 [Lasiosphaeria ovina]